MVARDTDKESYLRFVRSSRGGGSMVGRWPKLAGRFLVVNGGRQGRQAGSVIVEGFYNQCGWWLVGVTL